MVEAVPENQPAEIIPTVEEGELRKSVRAKKPPHIIHEPKAITSVKRHKSWYSGQITCKKIDNETLELSGFKISYKQPEVLAAAELFIYLQGNEANTQMLKKRMESRMNVIDLEKLEAYIFEPNAATTYFISYLRKWGIRLYTN